MVAPPKSTPIPPAAPPPAQQEQPLLITQTGSTTPDALDALQHDQGKDNPEPTPITSATQVPVDPLGQTVVATAGGVYLQFGAFSAMNTAQTLAQKLNSQIGTVESRTAHVQSTERLFRVPIGPYPSRTARSEEQTSELKSL